MAIYYTSHFRYFQKPNTRERQMKQSIDPFEAAFEEPEDLQDDDFQAQLETPCSTEPLTIREPPLGSSGINASNAMNDEDEEEEENIDAVFQSINPMPYSGDPDKLARTKAIVSQLTGDQMDRYEIFRRSRFRKSDMRRLLLLITGMRTISEPMIVAVSATTKMFVGEIVETARIVMTERKDSGPIRPCHIREAYRRLKLEGKVPRRTVPRLLL